jgi:two-component system NarL family sensor kinase
VTEYLIPLILFGSLILIMFVFIIVIFLVIHKQRLERHKDDMREINSRFESELLRTRLEVQEQALNHISREIHDNIGQVLTGSHLKILTLTNPALDPLEVSRSLSEVSGRMGKAIQDLRNLSHTLNGDMIEKIGLIEAIEKELTFTRSLYNLKCTFECSGILPELSPEQDILLFRIVQESIMNILKHAKADELNINMKSEDGLFTLSIADNGIGIDLESYKQKGLGLQNIEERIKLLKGNLTIESNKGKGTTIILSCKLKDEQTI